MARHEGKLANEDNVRHEHPSGVKFSDGTTLTPRDVKYSFDP